MNKISVYVLLLIVSVLCGCSNISENNNPVGEYVTDASTISDNSDIVENTVPESINIENDGIKKVIDFIMQNRIYNGCFYDFDRNGTPELVEIIEGEYFSSYNIYDIQGEAPQYMGELSADAVTDTANMLTLYYDSNLNEYFYFGKTYIIHNGTDIDDKFYLWIYKINDKQIESDCVGEYTGVWDGEKYWYKNITFMGDELEDGYYNEDEINALLGVDKYLSQYEKIEKVEFVLLWGYEHDENFEKSVKVELCKYPNLI